jgi:hypothetical protein
MARNFVKFNKKVEQALKALETRLAYPSGAPSAVYTDVHGRSTIRDIEASQGIDGEDVGDPRSPIAMRRAASVSGQVQPRMGKW